MIAAPRSLAPILVLAITAFVALGHADEPTTPAPSEAPWATAHGALRHLHMGFDTEEGDHCSFTLDADAAIVSTGNGVWSGFPCAWPTGGRHFPVDDALRRAIVEALAAPDALIRVEAPERRPEPLGYFEEHRVVTSEGEFAPSMLALVAIDEAARKFVEPWPKRDADDGLDGLIVTWKSDGADVRLLGERHGVLWESRMKAGGESSVRLRVLTGPERARLLGLLAGLEAVESAPDGGKRDVFVRFADRPRSVVEPLPEPIRQLITFLQE